MLPPKSKKGIGLFAVADGMGGAKNGEVASYWANKKLVETLQPETIDPSTTSPQDILDRLVGSVNAANAHLKTLNLAGGGTTSTAAIVLPPLEVNRFVPSLDLTQIGSSFSRNFSLVKGDQLALITQVGDSRAYVKRKGGPLEQITTDHSLVARLVATRQITPEEAKTDPRRNAIYRVLGDVRQKNFEVDTYAVVLHPGDELILNSDGMSEDTVRQHQHQPLEIMSSAEKLVQEALEKDGGHDNIAVVSVRAGVELPAPLTSKKVGKGDQKTSKAAPATPPPLKVEITEPTTPQASQPDQYEPVIGEEAAVLPIPGFEQEETTGQEAKETGRIEVSKKGVELVIDEDGKITINHPTKKRRVYIGNGGEGTPSSGPELVVISHPDAKQPVDLQLMYNPTQRSWTITESTGETTTLEPFKEGIKPANEHADFITIGGKTYFANCKDTILTIEPKYETPLFWKRPATTQAPPAAKATSRPSTAETSVSQQVEHHDTSTFGRGIYLSPEYEHNIDDGALIATYKPGPEGKSGKWTISQPNKKDITLTPDELQSNLQIGDRTYRVVHFSDTDRLAIQEDQTPPQPEKQKPLGHTVEYDIRDTTYPKKGAPKRVTLLHNQMEHAVTLGADEQLSTLNIAGPKVQPQHARISLSRGTWMIEPIENALIRVGGTKVTVAQPLNRGDLLRIGNTYYIVSFDKSGNLVLNAEKRPNSSMASKIKRRFGAK